MTTPIKPYNQIRQEDIDKEFLTGPGEDLVSKLLLQMSKVPGFIKIFGTYKRQSEVKNTEQRWADYQRFDWSLRQLPAICVFESQSENKESDQAFLNGVISIQVFWPANFRRPDSRRVESAMKGAFENFFNSKLVFSMLDELYWIQREEKVYGLNQLGKTLTWTPNVEGIVEDQQVPVTIIDVQYRIDLRAWNRALEFMGRTKEEPFDITLEDLKIIGGRNSVGLDSVYQGTDNDGVQIEIPDEIKVNQ
jgi:hypothetical protein